MADEEETTQHETYARYPGAPARTIGVEQNRQPHPEHRDRVKEGDSDDRPVKQIKRPQKRTPSFQPLRRKIVRLPLAAHIERMWSAIFIPHKQPPLTYDQRRPRPRHLLISGTIVKSPGSIDLAVGSTDRSLIAKTQPGCDLLVAQPLRQQFRHRLLIRLQQRHW